jgi:hypothetical protein
MKDLHAKLERLLAEAQDCDLIGNLAADHAKRATFRRMAEQLRDMAAQLKTDIAARSTETDGGAASAC